MAELYIDKTWDVAVEFNCGEYVEVNECEDDNNGTITVKLDDTLEDFLDRQAQETHGCDWEDLVNPDDE